MGDPGGVGPEVAAKALARPDVKTWCRPLIVGDAGVMSKALDLLDCALTLHPITDVARAWFTPSACDVLDLGNVDPADLHAGAALGGERPGLRSVRRSRHRAGLASAGGRPGNRSHQQSGAACCWRPIHRAHGVADAPDGWERHREPSDDNAGDAWAAGGARDAPRAAGGCGCSDHPGARAQHDPRDEQRIVSDGDAPAAAGGRGAEPARRGWGVDRARGDWRDRTGGGGGKTGGHRRKRPHPGRFGLLPGHWGRIRRGGGHVPWSGSHPDQDARLRAQCDGHAGPADRPHVRRPRHGVRHRVAGEGGREQHGGGDPAGGAAGVGPRVCGLGRFVV